MIIKTALNDNVGNLHRHLTREDDGNEQIRIVELRGCVAEDLLGAMREMKATSAGSSCKKPLYHVSFAATVKDADRMQSDAIWLHCAERFEAEFGLQNHARAVVHHFKEGRWHQHVVWNRINPDTGKAVHLAYERRRAIKIARELEQHLELTKVPSQRPEHRKEQRPPEQWEKEAGRRSKVDVDQVRDQIALCWQASKTGSQFQQLLGAQGLMLARGDRRSSLVIDEYGNLFALGSRVLPGERSRSINTKMADVSQSLPSVEQAKELQRQHSKSKRYKRKGGRSGDKENVGATEPDNAAPKTKAGRNFSSEHVSLKKQLQKSLAELKIKQEHAKLALDKAHANERAELGNGAHGLLARLTGAAKRAEQKRQMKLRQIEREATAQATAHRKAQDQLRKEYELRAEALRKQERNAKSQYDTQPARKSAASRSFNRQASAENSETTEQFNRNAHRERARKMALERAREMERERERTRSR